MAVAMMAVHMSLFNLIFCGLPCILGHPQVQSEASVTLASGRCGPGFPLASGQPAQCRPDKEQDLVGPCCSKWGFCGQTGLHCSCPSCHDFRTGGWDKSPGSVGSDHDVFDENNPEPITDKQLAQWEAEDEADCLRLTGQVCTKPLAYGGGSSHGYGGYTYGYTALGYSGYSPLAGPFSDYGRKCYWHPRGRCMSSRRGRCLN